MGAKSSNNNGLSLVNNFFKTLFQKINITKIFRRALAFTLAETLIVIGIIGVVAALTIPNLNSSTADREKVAKLKKIYAQVNEAFGRAQAVYGPIDEWPFPDGNDDGETDKFLMDRLTEFMKYQKIEYVYHEPEGYNLWTVYLADGSSFSSQLSGGGDDSSSANKNVHWWGTIRVDIDGPNKGKNKYGYDKFDFDITENGLFPNSSQDDIEARGCATTYCEFDGYYYATAWVIQNGNMDYLKTSDGKTCNDSDIVLDWTTNTSCK